MKFSFWLLLPIIVNSEEKNLHPRSKFFSCRADTILKSFVQESKSCFPLKMAENIAVYPPRVYGYTSKDDNSALEKNLPPFT